MSPSQRHRKLCAALLITTVVVLLVFEVLRRDLYPAHFVIDKDKSQAKAPRRSNIVVASHFPQHFDVHLAATHTIRQVLGKDGHVQVFAYTPLRFGFQDVVDSLDLFDQVIQHPDDLMAALKSTPAYSENSAGKMIDLVLFGTCEVDMNRWSDELLAVWDARPDDQKFKVVCIVHHFRDTDWQRHIRPWALRRSIRLLPLGYHVGRSFRTHFQELADSPEPELLNALYEYIDIDVHAPVLNLPEYGHRSTSVALSRAVIQGNLQIDRRDYAGIYADLLNSLKYNPAAWGYRALANDRVVYEPLLNSLHEPFELHLIGDGHLDIPKELSNIVFLHGGLNYTDFYALMQTMDIVIPAFVNKDYYDFQASSTVAMAVQCNVPILASKRMRTAYGYINDSRVTVPRPQVLREIYAIGALRTGLLTEVYPGGASQHDTYQGEVSAMLDHGWRNTQKGFQKFKQELWERNRKTIRRVLEDLPGEI